MTDSIVTYEKLGQIAVITANRPKQINAQSRRLLESLDETFAEAAEDNEVRVITLFGAGKHFSAGHDLGSTEELEDQKQRPIGSGIRNRYNHSREQFVDKTMRWRNLPKPTIAGVQGYCIYGGWIVASAMDLIFAADSAMFLASNFQYMSVPWDIHPRKAKELLFESRFINAQEAFDLELVNRVVPEAQLRDEVLDYATRVARNDPFQLRMMKLAVNQMQDTQGFHAHINSAHLMHLLSSEGERDPDFALKQPEGKRRPMVAQALKNYEESQKK